MTLDTLLAVLMLAALVAYAVLGGADFGAGIWDLLSVGPRRAAHREALANAIGPVWEANHVWLIYLVVLLFTCFPAAYAAASVALFWPLHLVLAGIVLRGSAFVFRAYAADRPATRQVWGRVFGASSALTPMLLGMCLGSLSTGALRGAGRAVPPAGAWIDAFTASTGLLALLLCAYLAAVYLAWEVADREVRQDFRRRAIGCWMAAGVCSVLTLWLARSHAPRLWEGLVTWPAAACLVAGGLLAPLSLWALWHERFGAARLLGGAQIAALLAGWAIAQWPYLIYPDLTIANAAAPASTLALTAITVPLGLAVLLPSLWFLFAVFKSRPGTAGR